VAVPVFAALILLVAYQNLVTIPGLKHAPRAAQTGLDGDFVSLIGANSRSEGAKSFQIHRNKPVIFEVDIPVTGEFASYVCEVQSEVRGSVYDDEVSGEDAKRTVHLIVPKGRLATGTFKLVIFGKRPAAAGPTARTEIDRVAFNLASVP
jgi:hypothetical protein